MRSFDNVYINPRQMYGLQVLSLTPYVTCTLIVKSGSRGATCTPVFLAVLSPRPEHGNNLNTHPWRRGFKNVVYAYDGAFFNLLSKRKEILPFATP